VVLQTSNCFSSDTATAWVSVFNTGLSEWSSSVSIFPNPVTDELNIVGVNGEEVTIQFLDGRVAMVSPIVDEKVNVQELPTGAYVLRVSSGETIRSYRFFKLK
jgi:hypothetical protein